MGNLQLAKQKEETVQQTASRLSDHADKVAARALALDRETSTALQNVDTITAQVIANAGTDPNDQRMALMRSRELAQAKLIANQKVRRQQSLDIEARQAAATAAALKRLAGRQTATNVYSCPEFKSCTGPGPYNQRRAASIARDYNRAFARKNGDMFMKPGSIESGGENACVVSGTFLDRVSREYHDAKRKFQYNCDEDKGWHLSSVEDVEGMVGRMAY